MIQNLLNFTSHKSGLRMGSFVTNIFNIEGPIEPVVLMKMQKMIQ